MFRDDETARAERLAALEREAKRADILAERVRELEAENHNLRAQLARLEPTMAPPALPPVPDVYVDAKLEHYVRMIIDATRDPRRADRILSGALPIDATRITNRARELAAQVGRRYAIPADIKAAVREVLPERVIMRRGSPDTVVEELLAQIEVP